MKTSKRAIIIAIKVMFVIGGVFLLRLYLKDPVFNKVAPVTGMIIGLIVGYRIRTFDEEVENGD